jgi:hypothetical protein
MDAGIFTTSAVDELAVGSKGVNWRLLLTMTDFARVRNFPRDFLLPVIKFR